ncbi:anti-phage deoxyguanosine triphosphatase [Shewanella colwelliana]|uniref:anti-phage deoxyguanosine triphosphatase n=1 Tax=Shewanella colwelliana TaxID=23 RepID=UPI0022AFDAA7|nr:anti-phage deoxyguanosine triphosphatase [Shewanella colwelliana]MCZ4338094.1 anti-phage deoxyguanosine triphosphatase [Shewanella colwelliana]
MTSAVWHDRRLGEHKQRRNDHRSPYQRDRARILHSAAFRRLQAKTQVLGVGMNDFYRTRLTHSLEVSQIGTGICAQLKQKYPALDYLLDSMSLIESLCLAHDIGHPPFGHGGEVALNYMMRNDGGFEGNGQTFRILTALEPYTEHFGMNLCRRTLLGILKYPSCHAQLYQSHPKPEVVSYRQLKPSQWRPVKAIFDEDKAILDWVLNPLCAEDKTLFLATKTLGDNEHKRTLYKSFDCSIMELADDTAYAIHDLEDAIVMGIVTQAMWKKDVEQALIDSEDAWIRQEFSTIGDKLFALEHHQRKDAIGTLVNGFVTAIMIDENSHFTEPLLRFNAVLDPPFHKALDILKQFVYTHVIRKPEIQMLEYKGQQIVMELFEAFASDPQRLLPLNTQERWQMAVNKGQNSHRVIADYISGMTDEFAARLHQHLFSAKAGSLIDLQ